MIFRFTAIFLFIVYLPNLILGDESGGLIEENFGERFYGVYLSEFKLGYLIHKVSQTDDTVTQDFSMNMRMSISEEEQKQHKAKYAFSQTISQYQFYKETGLLNKATKVDGVYDSDPNENKNAKRYDTVTFQDCLEKRLKILDSTAFSLCMDNSKPIIVFDISGPDNIHKALIGETIGTLVHSE